MALESEVSSTQNDHEEEEEIGCFFLQPSSSPYNLAEKVQQANFDLFNGTPQSTRSTKVKFRDELVSFEPDLTDDDVNSIESDHVDELPIRTEEVQKEEFKVEEIKLPYNTVLRNDIEIFNIEEEIEEVDEAVIEQAVLAEYNNDLNEMEEVVSSEEITSETEPKETLKDSSRGLEKPNSETGSSKSKKPAKRQKKTMKSQEIHCKQHCIERIDNIAMSIKKLEIHEKPPVTLPPLQLHQRKCCDEVRLSNSERNLPNYNGYRSEYGLSSRQIKLRDRQMEMVRQKEITRQKLIEEYRALKVQRNEEVFCHWLKEVTRRSKEPNLRNQLNRSKGYKSVSPGSYGTISPNIIQEKLKERPKTAGFVPKTNIKKKKRPYTTQSCVYIEVPPNVLKKGIHIGDLLITNSKQLSKKLHILTVS
ncbi:uncharacterized protein LOC126741295 [Anthonomus grandis grandis]|uniref:uncharacterized protein LOC126741295 n=1 Tax=Anthonomus grandis grandis TaxID=2921223 RepID=UPI0021664117|nr:uncharacterized protein LOC126741295 [Anthonomus grandis grandis]